MNAPDLEAPLKPQPTAPLFSAGQPFHYSERTGPTSAEEVVVCIAPALGDPQAGYVLVKFPDGHLWDVPIAELKSVKADIAVVYLSYEAQIQELKARIQSLETRLEDKALQLEAVNLALSLTDDS